MGLDDAGAIGIMGVVLLYVARAIRHDVKRWCQRANGGSAHERMVSLLEGIDRHLSEHRAEMARYQTSIATLLGEIKGRLSR